jgi:hypothetical protein
MLNASGAHDWLKRVVCPLGSDFEKVNVSFLTPVSKLCNLANKRGDTNSPGDHHNRFRSVGGEKEVPADV